MNTRKQVLIMSALLLMMLVVVAIYAAWYPSRATDSEAYFEEARAERGSILFARNCRLCHGDVGEGGALGGRLAAAPALNRPDLQGFENSEATLTSEITPTATTIEVSDGSLISAGDIILIGEERMEVLSLDGNTAEVQRGVGGTEASGHFPEARIWAFDEVTLTETLTYMDNVISCGRVGTAMPAWAQEHGGPLSDEQIDQLTVLISTARWDLVDHHVEEEDATESVLTAPVAPDATEIMVSDITRFTPDEAIRLGDERLRILTVPEFDPNDTNVPGTLTVERALYGTFAGDHPAGTDVFRFPEVAEPATNEESCGQVAQAPAATGPCPETDGVIEMEANNTAYNCSEIEVDSGEDVTISLTNLESVPHNVAVYISEEDLTPVADGSVGNIFAGPDVEQSISFTAPDAGEYFFRCDAHPVQMVGTFISN